MSIDMTGERNLHIVARFAAELGERIREEDPRELFDQLVGLCRNHPVKAAQLLMTHAAWFDPNTPMSVLTGRAEAITKSRVDAVMGRSA